MKVILKKSDLEGGIEVLKQKCMQSFYNRPIELQTEEACIEFINLEPSFLIDFTEGLKTRKVCFEAVKKNPDLMNFVPEQLRQVIADDLENFQKAKDLEIALNTADKKAKDSDNSASDSEILETSESVRKKYGIQGQNLFDAMEEYRKNEKNLKDADVKTNKNKSNPMVDEIKKQMIMNGQKYFDF